MDSEQIVHEVAEKVRSLISDAEARAAEIVRNAEAEAKSIRERAEAESHERLAAARGAFEELQSKLGLGAEVEPGPVTAPEPEPPSVPEPEPAPIPEPTPPPDEGTPPAAGNGDARSDDAASARLVAMNMALDGASREAIEGHLTENYALADTGSLVDDVLKLAAK